MNSRLIVLMALSCPSQIGTAVNKRMGRRNAPRVTCDAGWLVLALKCEGFLAERHAVFAFISIPSLLRKHWDRSHPVPPHPGLSPGERETPSTVSRPSKD